MWMKKQNTLHLLKALNYNGLKKHDLVDLTLWGGLDVMGGLDVTGGLDVRDKII